MSILSTLFSVGGCNDKSEKIYAGTSEFMKVEKKLPIKKEQVIKIYDNSFSKNFPNEDKAIIDSNFWKTIYIYKETYHIGYIHKLDKKGPQNEIMHYKVKINPVTGEISVVK